MLAATPLVDAMVAMRNVPLTLMLFVFSAGGGICTGNVNYQF